MGFLHSRVWDFDPTVENAELELAPSLAHDIKNSTHASNRPTPQADSSQSDCFVPAAFLPYCLRFAETCLIAEFANKADYTHTYAHKYAHTHRPDNGICGYPQGGLGRRCGQRGPGLSCRGHETACAGAEYVLSVPNRDTEKERSLTSLAEDDELLVKLNATGLCMSDVHYMMNDWGMGAM